MLILTRKPGESIIIGDNIRVFILEVKQHQVRLGIEAPRIIPIYREEILRLIQAREFPYAPPYAPVIPPPLTAPEVGNELQVSPLIHPAAASEVQNELWPAPMIHPATAPEVGNELHVSPLILPPPAPQTENGNPVSPPDLPE